MIGLDVGDKRIGIAATDGLGLTAQGLPTLNRSKLNDDLDYMIRIIDERKASRLVVGLPRNMDGSIGFQGEKVYGFISALLEKMNKIGLNEPDVIYWDERLTTKAALLTLRETGMSRKKRKGTTDQLAAVLILQGYLDRLRNLSVDNTTQ